MTRKREMHAMAPSLLYVRISSTRLFHRIRQSIFPGIAETSREKYHGIWVGSEKLAQNRLLKRRRNATMISYAVWAMAKSCTAKRRRKWIKYEINELSGRALFGSLSKPNFRTGSPSSFQVILQQREL
jgi:hypothetical protein